MQETSSLYKKAVYAPSRKVSANIEFQILNTEAYEEMTTVVASSNAPLSRLKQVTNKVRRMSKRYATFEKDYILLDGSFVVPPRPTENLSSEVGWWSGLLCDETGAWGITQGIIVTSEKPVSSLGLSFTFDPVANEYPVDFDIYVEDMHGVSLLNKQVRDHNSAFYQYPEPLTDYSHVEINILKWNKPLRRARITEIDFGLIQTYDNNKLMSVSLLEEMNVVGDTLPSNEIKFVVDNTDKTFNILNPQGYYKFLEKNQQVTLSFGLEVVPGTFEWVTISKYYLTDWKSDEGSLTTTFTARDFLDALESIDYISIANTNLYALAEDIFLRAGITSYIIDAGLQSIPTQGFKEVISSRRALQCIGIAGKAAIYQDRNTGAPVVRRFVEMDTRTTFLNYVGESGYFVGDVTYMYADGGYGMKSIDFNNAYKEPQITLSDVVKNIDMSVVVYEEDTYDQVLSTVVTVPTTLTVLLQYQKPIIASSVSVNITKGKDLTVPFTILNSYDNGIQLRIDAGADIDVSISISGKTLADITTVYRLANPAVKEGTTLLVENPLINTSEHALEVGQWLAAEFAARAEYSINWRQNPALECGDIILVEDSFGTKKQSRITKQEYNYQGYLNGKSGTKGGI